MSSKPRPSNTESEFLAVVRKSSNEVVALHLEVYKGHPMLCVRVYEVSDDKRLWFTTHGLNMPVWLWRDALRHIESVASTDGICGPPVVIPKSWNQELRIGRQEYNGVARVSVRVFRDTLTLGRLPIKSGLNLTPDIWQELLPHIKATLDEIGE